MKMAPSILAANFANLGHDVKIVSDAGADYLHIDIMDGHFVPNISFGPSIVKSIRSYTDIPFDVHLMIQNPDQYIEDFVKAGADIITVHVEACPHLHRTLQLIRSFGVKAGVVINPATSASILEPVLHEVDMILCMTVNPGFGGQAFIPSVLPKIEWLAEQREKNNYLYEIEVDGGVNEETIIDCANAGADVFVAGSAIFAKDDPAEALQNLKSVAMKHVRRG
ncbi:ribulose-phosphate 3-epimerase [Mangrovibacillus cuniculi]|uniref:Ribulose-phosphate 3-epimerase n=1 Tax=Mangrovibacillus cuniculi TaxID=2593652 RepID=A0A7S8CAE5_9BACI|nr:ribulose-phosphate 3-epimerase [Mangrovibacillus cuniculi]QPC46302.1 ribulose-phosphate 3-epimerase [Mangrovibacillus cuniculi]